MEASQNWYRTYFSEPYGEMYDEYLLPPEIDREEAQFACDALSLQPGDSVLDCPCGYGRHMHCLRGILPGMIGLDLSPDCLKRAADRLADPRLVRADMRALPFADQSFDAIFNLFNSFGYFGPQEDRRVLAEFARVLRPGGGALLDVANPAPLLDIIAEYPRTRQQVHDLLLTEDWRYDPETRLLHNSTRIRLAGRNIKRSYQVRLYRLDEMRDLLAEAGLHFEAVYGDFDGEAYDPEKSARLIVIAVREMKRES